MASGIQFEWDEFKCQSNIGKHGIDFRRAIKVFDGRTISWTSVRDGEARWLAVGLLHDIEITVVFTMREGRIRIISARRAYRNERKKYRAGDHG